MNWFTKSTIGHLPVEKKQALIDQDGGCQHVENDPSLATHVSRENDSFGIVSQYVCCQACFEELKQEEGRKVVTCNDCHGVFEAKDTKQWRWYDFYAAQGDIPLTVCNTCWDKDRHQNRMAKDHQDYIDELGYSATPP